MDPNKAPASVWNRNTGLGSFSNGEGLEISHPIGVPSFVVRFENICSYPPIYAIASSRWDRESSTPV